MSAARNVHYFARSDVFGGAIMRNCSPITPGMVHPGLEGEIVLCQWGYHGSTEILDALRYADSPMYCPRRLSGSIVEGSDKLAASECQTLAVIDLRHLLHEFSCRLAEYYLDNFEVEWPETQRQLIGLKRSWLGGFITRTYLEISMRGACPALQGLCGWYAHTAAFKVYRDILYWTTLPHADTRDGMWEAISTQIKAAASQIMADLFVEYGVPDYVGVGNE